MLILPLALSLIHRLKQARLLEQDSSRTQLRQLRAKTLWSAGRFSEAQREALHVLALEPNDPLALRLLARFAGWEGDIARGLRLTEQVLRERPRDVRALELAAAYAYRLGRFEQAGELAQRLRAADPSQPNPVAREIREALAQRAGVQ